MTEPDNWLEFLPADPDECLLLALRIRKYFNLTDSHIICFCFGYIDYCEEPYKSMEDILNAKFDRILEVDIQGRFEKTKEFRLSVYTFYGVVMLVGIAGGFYLGISYN